MSAVVVGSVWLWKVDHVTCSHPERECTDTEIRALKSLQGQRMLFNKIPVVSLGANTGVYIAEYARRWPMTLHVTLANERILFIAQVEEESWAITDRHTLLLLQEIPASISSVHVSPSVWHIWQDSSEEFMRDTQLLAAFLSESHSQALTEIAYDDTHVLSFRSDERTVILNLHEWQLDWQRWHVIQSGIDWSTYPEPIVEVDTRYALPVLRTTPTLPRHNS